MLTKALWIGLAIVALILWGVYTLIPHWTETSCPPSKRLTYCILTRGSSGSIWDRTFSPDGKLLAFVKYNIDSWQITLWRIASKQLMYTFSASKDLVDVTALAFSCDGKLLAFGSRDQDEAIKLWEVATGKEITLPSFKMSEAKSCSPGSYDVRTAVSLTRQLSVTTHCVQYHFLSPVCATYEAQILQYPTGEVRTLPNSQQYLGVGPFSPDGTLLLGLGLGI